MLVHKKSNSLILELPDPTTVTAAIPKSRVVEVNGKRLTQVRFGVDEVRVLRNLGIKAPSPIGFMYDWPSRYPAPFIHQKVTSEFFTLNRRAICLNDMGTGKTLSALWAADYLMDQGMIQKALIVCPRSTMNSVWADEIITHLLYKRRAVVLSGDRARRHKLLEEDVDFYIINHDGLKVIADALTKRTDINLKLIDEAAAYRNSQSARFKLLRSLVRQTDWLWLMTGTPCPNAPTDAWALARLLDSPAAPKYFSGFRNQTMLQVTQHKWVPKHDGHQQAYAILQPGIRFKKEDCIDLPPVSFQSRLCDLTPEQARAYKDMHKHLVMTAGSAPITAANAAVKLAKLLQVCVGTVYDEHGAVHYLDSKPRIDACDELIEEAAQKVIVFAPFKGTLELLNRHYADKFHRTGDPRWKAAMVHGDVGDTERKDIFHAFQHSDEPRILLAHPATAAHGLTLTRADTTIWYAPIFSLEIYEQANNRMNRPGQKFPMTVATLAAHPMEVAVYHALGGKARMQDSVLQLYKKELTT